LQECRSDEGEDVEWSGEILESKSDPADQTGAQGDEYNSKVSSNKARPSTEQYHASQKGPLDQERLASEYSKENDQANPPKATDIASPHSQPDDSLYEANPLADIQPVCSQSFAAQPSMHYKEAEGRDDAKPQFSLQLDAPF